MEKKYFKNRVIYLFFLFFGFVSFSYSQKINIVNEVVEPINLNSEGKFLNENEMFKKEFSNLEGTYQIQIFKPNYTILLSKAVLELIKTQRKENEDVVIVLDDYSKLFLPSINNIRSASFVKLSQFQSIIK